MRKPLVLFIFIVLIFSPFILSSQEGRGKGRIKGVVVNEKGEPVEGAEITAQSLEFQRVLKTKTNKNGEWAILGMGTGMWRFTVRKKGYFPVYQDRYIRQLVQNKDLNFTLKESPVSIISDKKIIKKVEEGNKFFSEGKYSRALEIFKELLEEHPDELFFLKLNIANCYRKIGEKEKAKKLFLSLIEECEKKEGGYVLELIGKASAALGEMFAEEKNWNSAEKYFEKAVQIYKNDENLFYNLGEIYFYLYETDKAIEMFKKAISLNPDWEKPYIKLGYAYLNKGDIDKAVEVFNQFLTKFPESKNAPQIREIVKSLSKK